MGPLDGRWKVQITDSTEVRFVGTAEKAEQVARRALVRLFGAPTA